MARLDEVLAKEKTPAVAPSTNVGALAGSPVRAQLEQQGLALYVDLQRLAAGVKALPPEAWGVGGFAIKAATERWLDAASDLHGIYAAGNSTENAVQSEVTLRFSAP
jgi:hypothetical protein